MHVFSKKPHGLCKRINYLLKSANLSLEVMVGLRARKVYRLLKKATKVAESLNFSKVELKRISILIAHGNFHKTKIIIQISQIIFKIKMSFQKQSIFIRPLVISIPFLGTFFDKKQIIRC